jgi:glucosamine 6-phosphate synthetase-like amidotransferase/phosphosugar isomerase protein
MEQLKTPSRVVIVPTAQEPEKMDNNLIQDPTKSCEKIEPLEQLEGFQLFAYFTANIIKEDVTFTR